MKCFPFLPVRLQFGTRSHTAHIPVDKVDVHINANHIPYTHRIHTHTLTLNITLKFGMHSHKLALKRNCLLYCERQKDIYKWEPKINDWKKRALTRKIINKRSDRISAWNCTKNLCWWVANKIALKPIKSTQQVWNLLSRRDVMNEAKTLREWERERKKRKCTTEVFERKLHMEWDTVFKVFFCNVFGILTYIMLLCTQFDLLPSQKREKKHLPRQIRWWRC